MNVRANKCFLNLWISRGVVAHFSSDNSDIGVLMLRMPSGLSCCRDNRHQGTVSAYCSSAQRFCFSDKQKISSTCHRPQRFVCFSKEPLNMLKFVPLYDIHMHLVNPRQLIWPK